MRKVEFFECVCTSDQHTLRFSLDSYDPKDVELYVSVFLNQYRNFFCRIWIAIKYIFGYKCRYGHWDCTILKIEDADRLIDLLENYKRLSDERGSSDNLFCIKSKEKETGIPCFECGEQSGIDCPGRNSDEATRCVLCMRKFLDQIEVAGQVTEGNGDVLEKLADS